MKKLIVDIGNTRSKFHLFEEAHLKSSKIFENEEDEEILSYVKELNFDRSIVSASGELSEELLILLREPIILSSELTFPFSIEYSTPETLGTDRLALVAGGKAIHPSGTKLIISAGTCITYDLLTNKDEYLGGGISPGLTMRLHSMHTFTHKLPLLDVSEKDDYPLVGKSTKESMESGAYNGFVAEVDGIIDRYKELYKDLTILLTGGDADFLAERLKNSIFGHANLQAIGLNFILDNNNANNPQ